MTSGTETGRRIAIATFEARDKADAAVTALQQAGFSARDIGVVARRTSEWDDMVGEADADETAATGALAGAAAGAGIGGLWALGIAAGVMPALGPVVAGGLLGSLLASAMGGAATGGIAGALIGLGLSEAEAGHYHEELAAGRTVVTVRAGERYVEAATILDDHGGMLSPSQEAPVDLSGAGPMIP